MEALKIAQKNIRENAFEHKKEKPGLNVTPGYALNRPSNNWAQETRLMEAFKYIQLTRKASLANTYHLFLFRPLNYERVL